MYVIVTGGSRGIGNQIVQQLIPKGYNIILTATQLDSAKNAAESLTAQLPPNQSILPFELKLQQESSVKQFVEELKQKLGGQQIDALINNSGVLVRHVWDKATWDDTVAVNTWGTLSLTEQLIPQIKPNGKVIMVSSSLGMLVNLPQYYSDAIPKCNSLEELKQIDWVEQSVEDYMAPTYNVSKALLNRAMQFLGVSPLLQDKNISIHAVCPGWCRTDMGSEAATRSPEEGAADVVYVLVNNNIKNISFTDVQGAEKEW